MTPRYALLALVLSATPALAGNPLTVVRSGEPPRWPGGGSGIVFLTDQGSLGPLDGEAAVALAVTAFGRWQDLPTATISYVHAGSLPFDVDGSNFGEFAFTSEGPSAVVFDDDGVIFEEMFGPDSGVLGFNMLFWDDTARILRAVVVLSGPAAAEMPDLYLGVAVHEAGHFSGLDHSVANGQMAMLGDSSGPSPHDTFGRPASFDGLIETMYPFVIPSLHDGGEDTPDRDDAAGLSALYPEPSFGASTGAISGHIRSASGAPLSGLNVVARNLADPFRDVVSALSGHMAVPFAPGDPLAGAFRIPGLTPGGQYAVFVDEVHFGSFSVPLARLPGAPEELYNGAGESNGADHPDDPAAFTPIVTAAGQTVAGVDIVLNRPQPGVIPLGDHAAVEIPLRFPFRMCGRTFTSAWVNSNGSLSFGAATFGLAPSRLDLLFGPPVIAPFWARLIPSEGVVAWDETPDTFTLTFTGVPAVDENGEWAGLNTFSLVLMPGPGNHGGRAHIEYGELTAGDAIAGYGCGAGVTSGMEAPTDLSALPGGIVKGEGLTAVYEQLGQASGRPLDLRDRRLNIKLPRGFDDAFEPNDTAAAAAHVALPFDTSREFAELVEGDVDFYRFHARAGETLVAETHPGLFAGVFDPPAGRPDTRLGLFRLAPGGPVLMASNDDTAGTFSRVIMTAPANGHYLVAVTTSEDEDFTGAGPQGGRYVLSLAAYGGRVLDLRRFDTIEVELPFAFPFQGGTWSSVWVNSQGSLTFGEGDALSVGLAAFLGGPPRIAPLMTSLAPAGGFTGIEGLVLVEEEPDSVTVRWVSVPGEELFHTATVAATLRASGRVEMSWGAVGLDREGVQPTPDGAPVVGITEGRGAPPLGAIDLSTIKKGPVAGTIYQLLGPCSRATCPPFALHFDELRFVRPAAFVLAPREVAAAGRSGSLDYNVEFGYTGPFAARAHGLTAADTRAGIVPDDPTNRFRITGPGVARYDLEVPAGTLHARFALFDEETDGRDDLDLYVVAPNGLRAGASRARGSASEQITVDFPAPGTYAVYVHGFETEGPDATFTLFHWNVASGPPASLTVGAPSVAIAGTVGRVTVTWSGLGAGRRYLGSVSHHAVASPATVEDGLLRLTLIAVETSRPVVAPREVNGGGVNGTLSYSIHFGYTGAFTALPHGLVPARADAASVPDDPANDFFGAVESGVGVTAHTLEVPPGATHVRIALFDRDTDGHHDLDLWLFDPQGVQVALSAGATSQEEVRLDAPAPGTYTAYVHGYETDGPQAEYTLFSWALTAGTVGTLSVSAPTAAVEGAQRLVTLGWEALSPVTRYLGTVTYHTTAAPSGPTDGLAGSTFVRVDP